MSPGVLVYEEKHCPLFPRGKMLSSYTEVCSVIYDSGSIPRRAIFSPRETLLRGGKILFRFGRARIRTALQAGKGKGPPQEQVSEHLGPSVYNKIPSVSTRLADATSVSKMLTSVHTTLLCVPTTGRTPSPGTRRALPPVSARKM